jgi:tetratricopeptide (TPR) repeat protein/mono/diheme cytochrome c family protein
VEQEVENTLSSEGTSSVIAQRILLFERGVRVLSKMLNAYGLTAGAVLLLVCSSQVAGQSVPTFSRDVGPILQKHCVSCHQPDGDGPFSLATFEDARRHVNQIVDVTGRHTMPPWKPEDANVFVGERRLTDHEILTIRRWARGGASEGIRYKDSELIASSSYWRNGEPDLIVRLPTYTLRADGPDVFRNFVVPVPGNDTHYVRAWQFRPGSRAVHHANIRIDPTMASRRLDETDPEPGYEGVILHSADYPDGQFLGWTPGQAPPIATADLAWKLRGGNDLVVQLHMRPTGREEVVAPAIGLYFSQSPPSKTPVIVRLSRQNLDIPAGAKDHRVSDAYVLPVDADIAAIQPHAHYRPRTVRAWASLPDGTERRLLTIRDWDFNWQDQYRYRTPFLLPAGTTLHMEYSFDNSDSNPRNPDHPASRVRWGWRSSDEMADVWIQMLTRSDRDQATLARSARHKMAVEDAIGSEVLIAREPDYVSLRNDAALIYMELDQPAKALEHFAAVTRLQPSAATAWYNEGVALEAQGALAAASGRYAEAIRLDPQYSAAHNNLANVLYHNGNASEALSHYHIAITANPLNAEAHCAYARALTETGDALNAVTHYRAAIDIRPDWAPCLINFSWLLSAHADRTIRQPAEAIRLAERSVALTDRRDPGALDALAAAYAAAGRFDEAIQTGLAAAALADHDGLVDGAKQIRTRIDVYKQKLPFIVP